MAETITLSTKVEYKKRRTPRAFKLWDSVVLCSTMIQSAEIKAKIEEASEKADKPINELGATTIKTELLYMITENYLHMYKKLLSESLLKTGNIKSNPNIH